MTKSTSSIEQDKVDSASTHFGFKTVPQNEKARLVEEVFSSVASRYDLMNDAMSLGAHRFWKRFAVTQSGLKDGDTVLDVAGGSADMSLLFARQVGPNGRIVLTDINPDMLNEGKTKMLNNGYVNQVEYQLADAENLPFEEQSFDCTCIAFGLRNVTRKSRAIASMCAVLKPGGRALILEFSKPTSQLLDKVYNFYSFNAIPRLGKLIANDERSYQYLVESIRKHPSQEELKNMMLGAGYDEVKVFNLSAGIVALHVGYKY